METKDNPFHIFDTPAIPRFSVERERLSTQAAKVQNTVQSKVRATTLVGIVTSLAGGRGGGAYSAL
jgi:hypothetical protein